MFHQFALQESILAMENPWKSAISRCLPIKSSMTKLGISQPCLSTGGYIPSIFPLHPKYIPIIRIYIIYPHINPYKIQRSWQPSSLVSPPALSAKALHEDLLLGGFFIHHAHRSGRGGRVNGSINHPCGLMVYTIYGDDLFYYCFANITFIQ